MAESVSRRKSISRNYYDIISPAVVGLLLKSRQVSHDARSTMVCLLVSNHPPFAWWSSNTNRSRCVTTIRLLLNVLLNAVSPAHSLRDVNVLSF